MDAREMGVFIAEHRKENNMTQKQLAEKLQVSDKAVSRWERGKGFPDIGTLEPLAKALNVTLSEMMQGSKAADEIEKDEVTELSGSASSKLMAELRRKNRVLDSIIGAVGLVGIAFFGLGIWFFEQGGHFSLRSRGTVVWVMGIGLLLIVLLYSVKRIEKRKEAFNQADRFVDTV